MKTEKIAIIIADASAGFVVFLMGLQMLTFPFDIIWVAFNLMLWIALPILILWSKNKEDAKNPLLE